MSAPLTARRNLLMATILAGVMAAGALAQATRPAGPRIAPVPRTPEYPQTDRVPDDSPRVLVLPSEPGEFGDERADRSGGVIARIVPEPRRLPDGYIVANRPGRIEREGDRVMVYLDPVEGLPDAQPMQALPNSRLGLLETVLARDDRPDRRFAITGRVTEFHGRNYILLENVTERTPRPAPSAAAAPEPQQPEGETPATQPVEPREPTAEEVVEQLLRARPRRSLVIPSQPTATAPADDTSAAESPEGWTEDTLIVDRPGRVLPNEPWWTFSFEDLSATPKDRPIRILPNQLLEQAIALSGGGERSRVLIVSGEITVHNKTHYLLLRKVIAQRDLGNFR